MLKKLFGGEKEKKKRILVAEDEKHIRLLIIKHLESQGYEVVGAADGREALSKLIAENFDALLTDVMMPHVHGLDLIKHFREDHKEEPVFVITGKGSKDLQAKIEGKIENVFYFRKPFKATVIIKKIKEELGDANG